MATEVKNLETHAIIGFDGSAIHGLKVHPGWEHIVYPMGNKVCIQEWKSKKMYFLSGHTNSVSTVALSPQGTYVGSGQINHIGFKASAKLWDFKKRTLIATHELHKVRVEAMAFSADERFMISLGGRDDGCVVLWDCKAGAATGTAPASKLTTGDAVTLTALNRRADAFVTGGDSTLRVWALAAGRGAPAAADVALGRLRRCVRCIAIARDDSIGYAGTTTGDMIKFSVGCGPSADGAAGAGGPDGAAGAAGEPRPALLGCLAKCGPCRRGRRPASVCYSLGIEAILIMDDGCLIVGAGDGTVDILDEINWKGDLPKGKILDPNRPHFKALKSTKLEGCITSLELVAPAGLLLAGTRECEVYALDARSLAATLLLTCHRCAINHVAFPRGMSGVFATGGAGSLRVWCLASGRELLRVLVPNFACSAVLFAADGRSVVSAWSDGAIRAFTPLSGRLVYCIPDAHNKGASALDATSDGRTLVSGGCEGQVRLWDVLPARRALRKVLKEHKSPVSAIQVSPDDLEAVSAGTDGSCIVWDLRSMSRRQVMYANTLFMCVCFEPRGRQLLTGGTDRRVAYWEAGSGNLARELEASKQGAVNGVHVSHDGELFVTGGNDQIVKLWRYQEGVYTHMGLGHAGAVTCCRFSPDGRYVVSCCAAGTIIVWKVPEQYLPRAEAAGAGAAAGRAPSPRALRLPLAARRAPRLPAAPHKEEKISAMDTSRSSVVACCPCPPSASPAPGPAPAPAGNKSCRAPDNLPTRTTSKEYVNGSGDRKKT